MELVGPRKPDAGHWPEVTTGEAGGRPKSWAPQPGSRPLSCREVSQALRWTQPSPTQGSAPPEAPGSILGSARRRWKPPSPVRADSAPCSCTSSALPPATRRCPNYQQIANTPKQLSLHINAAELVCISQPGPLRARSCDLLCRTKKFPCWTLVGSRKAMSASPALN